MTAPAQRFGFGAFTLDAAERLLLKHGRMVPITPKAFDLLAVMVRNPGRLLSKDELIKEVWPDTFIEESNLAYNVFTVRKALGEGTDEERYIETVPRRGYRFVAAIAPVDAATGEGGAGQAPTGDAWHADDRSTVQESASEAENGPLSMAPVSGPATAPGRQAWLGWVLAAMASIALIWLGTVHFAATPLPAELMRFQIPLPVQLLAYSDVYTFDVPIVFGTATQFRVRMVSAALILTRSSGFFSLYSDFLHTAHLDSVAVFDANGRAIESATISSAAGLSHPTGTAVPEPSSMLLLLVGGAAYLGKRGSRRE